MRVVLTPDEFRIDYASSRHAFGGFAPVMGKEGVPHRTPVRGLYFIGAQSASGGGIGNVIQGARRAHLMIVKDMRCGRAFPSRQNIPSCLSSRFEVPRWLSAFPRTDLRRRFTGLSIAA